MSIPILVIIILKLNVKDIDTTIINVDAYCTTCQLKIAPVFVLSLGNIQY